MNTRLFPLKLTLVFLMFIIIPSSVSSKSIHYLSDSYESIAQKGKSQNKYFFVKFAASWCATCKVMNNNANNNPTLVNFIEKNFLAVKADIENPVGKKWKDKFETCCLPTLIVFSPDGYEVNRKQGSISSSEFLSFLENAIGKKATLILKNTTPSYTLWETSVSNTPVAKPQPLTVISKEIVKSTSEWTLLISKHSNLQDANKEIKTLKNKLDDPIILSAKRNAQRLIYQISIGNISNEQEAIMLRKKLLAKNIRCSLIKE